MWQHASPPHSALSQDTPIPSSWFSGPPRTLVLGDGAYSHALTLILDAARLGAEDLLAGPAPNSAGGYPRVLAVLERVFLVADANRGAADLLRLHDALWRWVGMLSPDGEEHELAVLFLVPPATAKKVAESLALGLGLPRIDQDTAGHAVVPMDASLKLLAHAVASVKPQDLPPVRARQASDARHAALRALRNATGAQQIHAASMRVRDTFRGQEYHLDLFCRPPSHRNGNLLRGWLNGIVTESVTPHDQSESNEGPLDWLADANSPEPP